tara:strand:+ start:163 stop:336 length:174 start_codon:yes stop_codon:yes gene_type:complete
MIQAREQHCVVCGKDLHQQEHRAYCMDCGTKPRMHRIILDELAQQDFDRNVGTRQKG